MKRKSQPNSTPAGTDAGGALPTSKSPAGKPKFRRRSEARPDEVLDAALDLFIESGFSETRVEDIAARAGISKGAVYLYFPSKQSLLEGLVRRAVVTVAAHALEFVSRFEGSPREAISKTLRMLAKKLASPRLIAIPRIIMREVTHFPELADMYRREVLELVIPVMTRVVERGIREGHFRTVDPELTLRSIIGPVLAHLLLSEIFGVAPKDGMKLEQLVENHLSILFDGLSLPPEADK